MPRSRTRPQVGHIVWYYAASPPAAAALPAIVVAQVATAGTGVGSPPPTFDVAFYDPAAGAGAGAWTKVLALPFYYGTRPASGAWITMPRVTSPGGAGVWPSLSAEAEEYVEHNLTPEQREERREKLVEQLEKEAEEAAEREAKREAAREAEHEHELEEVAVEEDEEPPTRGRHAPPKGRSR
jgi:hypothetical protein